MTKGLQERRDDRTKECIVPRPLAGTWVEGNIISKVVQEVYIPGKWFQHGGWAVGWAVLEVVGWMV